MKLKIGDYIIISVVIICAVIMLLPVKNTGDIAVLHCDGQQVKTFDLSINTEFVFKGDYTNVIIVKDGAVSINDADCPDKVCVYSGKISKAGQSICCLPNKVIVRIISSKTETDVISG